MQTHDVSYYNLDMIILVGYRVKPQRGILFGYWLKSMNSICRILSKMIEETVWLTQNEISQLFDTTKQNVSLHINKAFKEKEFDKKSVVKDFFITASDGKVYRTKHYNLDVIISVGYRVKSQRGILFGYWLKSMNSIYGIMSKMI